MKNPLGLQVGLLLALLLLCGCGATPTDIGRTPTPTRVLPSATSVRLATSLAPATATSIAPTPTPAGPTATPMSPLVEIPAGEFTMGSEGGRSDELPVHVVYLDGFYIDRNEVTNAQFAEFLNDQGNQIEGGEAWLDIDDPDCMILERNGHFQPKTGFASHPAIEVTWYGARAYCEWRGQGRPETVRLPTEAEWEKAAAWDPVTSTRMAYPWGNEWQQDSANADWPIVTVTEVAPHTLPVGSNMSGGSPYGVLDMSGNVWEWVADWYDRSYYANSASRNPAGPDVGEEKVIRGGSWRSPPDFARTAVREHIAPDYTFDIGIRCVTAP